MKKPRTPLPSPHEGQGKKTPPKASDREAHAAAFPARPHPQLKPGEVLMQDKE